MFDIDHTNNEAFWNLIKKELIRTSSFLILIIEKTTASSKKLFKLNFFLTKRSFVRLKKIKKILFSTLC